MVQIEINTTQNVNINFTAATIGERILAYFIDLLIKIAYGIVMYQLIFNVLGIYEAIEHLDNWSRNSILVLFYFPVIFYSLFFEIFLDGQSPGKRIMKIQVVKIDGYQASLPDFVVRWFFRIVDVNMLAGIVAIVSIISNKNSQRLGDMTAGTSVISLKNNVTLNNTILEDLTDDYVPTYPNVIRLTDNDARIIKDTFTKARKAKDYQTLIKLRQKVVEVVEVKEQIKGTDMEFIDIILKDYNYYTQTM